MACGCVFVGQRPLRHAQSGDGPQRNPLPIARTDAQVSHTILQRARLVETLGFDSVWIAEHAFSEHSILRAPHSLLAAIAAQTTRVNVGVACAIVPWYHPLRLAQDLATHDMLSEGRLQIGIGRGYQQQECDAYGLDLADARARFLEGMDITLKAWRQERLAYEGQFYRFPEVMVVPQPLQPPPPPIAMAVTHSPASVEVAVQHRWGIVTVGRTFFPAVPEADDHLITLSRTHMLARGVAPEALTIMAARHTYVAAREGEAHAFMQPRLQWAGDLARY